MGGSELAPGGYTIDDAVAFAKLAEDKVDLLHVSCGAHYFIDTMTTMHPSMFLPHGVNVYLAAAVKKAVAIPVVAVGGLSDPAQMEEIIAGGQADVVAIARGLIADPDLPKKALRGEDDDDRPLPALLRMPERHVHQRDAEVHGEPGHRPGVRGGVRGAAGRVEEGARRRAAVRPACRRPSRPRRGATT